MSTIDSFITDSDILIKAHGRWPTFHDAEVIDIHLQRGEAIDPCSWPHLTARVHVFQEQPDSQPVCVTIRFDLIHDLSLTGFDHQNSLYGIRIDRDVSEFAVLFDSAQGLGASFRCGSITIVDVDASEATKPVEPTG